MTKNTLKGVSLKFAIISWFYSMIGKYIPGKVMLPLGRAYLYKEMGVGVSNVLSLFFLEFLTQAGGAFLLLVLIEPLLGINLGINKWIYIGFSHPRIIEKSFNIILKLMGREELKIEEKYGKVLFFILANALNLGIVGGFAFYLFISSFWTISISNLPFIAMALAVSSLAGFVLFLVPAGIGVREGVLLYLMKFILPSHMAIIISITSRIWLTIAEVLLILLGIISKILLHESK